MYALFPQKRVKYSEEVVQLFREKGVHRNFAKFTGKQLCRDSDTVVFL